MAYTVGIDVGTSYTAAAVSRRDGGVSADPEPVALGTRSIATASVVFVGDDGRLLVGDAAERRALTQPERIIREFKRRVGDSVPLIVGGWSHQAEDLAAIMVKWVVDRVADREGGPAEAIAVTHPASWGPYKLALFRQALAHLGLDDVTLLSEPVAAAAHYASQSRIDSGSTVAVYDLGGGTFDAAVVRKTADHTFELLGRPEGIDQLGGVDFDQAVFAHLQANANLSALDPADPDTVAALVRLRRDCTEAKEALSTDTETTIPVLLPQRQTRVRLVRAEFETMIRESVLETIAALRQAVTSAGIADEEISSVLLVGGSSRIPLIAQLISAEFGRPVAIDADPKATIALGAARTAAATVPVAAAEEEATSDGAPDAVAIATSVENPEREDPNAAGPEGAPVQHPYEQLLALRNGMQKEPSGIFGRVPSAAVAALIAVVITAAGAFAWTATIGSPRPAPAQATEQSPTPKVTTTVPSPQQATPSEVPTTAAPPAQPPAADEPQEAANTSRDNSGARTSSPTPSKKASSSTTTTSRAGSPAASSPPAAPSQTSQPPAPNPSPTTTQSSTPTPTQTTTSTPTSTPTPDPTTPEPTTSPSSTNPASPAGAY